VVKSERRRRRTTIVERVARQECVAHVNRYTRSTFPGRTCAQECHHRGDDSGSLEAANEWKRAGPARPAVVTRTTSTRTFARCTRVYCVTDVVVIIILPARTAANRPRCARARQIVSLLSRRWHSCDCRPRRTLTVHAKRPARRKHATHQQHTGQCVSTRELTSGSVVFSKTDRGKTDFRARPTTRRVRAQPSKFFPEISGMDDKDKIRKLFSWSSSLTWVMRPLERARRSPDDRSIWPSCGQHGSRKRFRGAPGRKPIAGYTIFLPAPRRIYRGRPAGPRFERRDFSLERLLFAFVCCGVTPWSPRSFKSTRPRHGNDHRQPFRTPYYYYY
jgi:hypothetical protein